jgi:hypothetical protein
MSNLPEPPPPLIEKLTAKKVLKFIGFGIFILSNIISRICIAVIFIYLGSTIPVLEPYANYVAIYTFGGRTIFLICVFLTACYWGCLRLVAPKQAGNSIDEWHSKVIAHSRETLNSSNGKLGKAWRTHFALIGILNTFNGLYYCSVKIPELGIYPNAMGVILLIGAACSIRIAYVGRMSMRKGTRGEDMIMGNNDTQPESHEISPAGAHKDDGTTTQ